MNRQINLLNDLFSFASGGSGVETEPIKSAIYNDDDTLDIVDKDDVEHEVVPTYTNNRITSISYDGTAMAVTYDGDGNLTKVGNCDIDGTEEYIGTGIVPSGSLSITENGTYDVTEKASAVVNVPSHIETFIANTGVNAIANVSVPEPIVANTGVTPTANCGINISGASVLLTGTTEVKEAYIQADGNQYIDTNITITNQSYFEIKFNYNETPNNDTWIFGNYEPLHDTMIGYYGGTIRCMVGGSSTEFQQFDNNVHIVQANSTEILYDDILISTPIWSDVPSGKYYIFWDGYASHNKSKGRIYYVKIWNGDTLVRDFIPAKSNEVGHENEVCLYDNVTEAYFYNQGTGTFTYGETVVSNTASVGDTLGLSSSAINVTSTTKQWQKGNLCNYIQSSGTQYIDTGFVHSANTKIELDCEILQTSAQQYEPLFGARNQNYRYNAFGFFNRFNGNWIPVYNRSGAETLGSNFIYNKRITLTCEGNIATWTDGTDTYSLTTTGTVNNGVCTIGLLTINSATSTSSFVPDDFFSTAKLYRVKIWDNDTLVRDFVPAQSQESGHENEVCLYDNVTNAYFYNQGSGTFIYGTELSDYEDITGATSSTYTVQTGDNAIRCALQGTGDYIGSTNSNITTII